MGEASTLINQTGIQITLLLMLIVVLAILLVFIFKFLYVYGKIVRNRQHPELQTGDDFSSEQPDAGDGRENSLEADGTQGELSGGLPARNEKEIIKNINAVKELRFFPPKRRTSSYLQYVSPELSRLILWFLGTAILWLIIGTSFGLYAGIKYVAPDLETASWLSFGRLRPAHTNAVFWGWASLAMVGLAYYVVTRVCNVENYNIKQGYISLILINAAVLAGTVSVMAGVNNGGGEYREYIWPIMGTFGIGIAVSSCNLFRPLVKRVVSEIYISNWYIISGFIFIVIVIFVGYVPLWQDGIGETITQGYYMHQAIGMWFMLVNLGLMYYFLPQQLNKPIYSYSLGILAFWTHVFFYTLIGPHHFIFSSIPWRIQTTAIVASVGMLIPVAAGTTNFLLTFNGSWYQLKTSYTLPFYFMSIIFYFTGSFQGTVEAFRYTNLLWHFTDFTVSHSHLTMYGIITFMLWAFSYTLVPRLTGKEPSKILVGIHFWLALIGLLFYVVALMIGGTQTGMMWMKKKPFIDGVINMFPYWLWRAIGGSMMWVAHLIFAFNFYTMIRKDSKYKKTETLAEILAVEKQLSDKEFNP